MNASKPVLLVTGFDAFGGEELNPSWEVCAALDGSELGGARVAALRLPCAFGVALDALDAGLAQHAPALVLCLGQAAGRADFSVERVAINVDDARLPDNLGACPVDAPVLAGGPAAYFSTLPIKAMVAALQGAGLPASVSQTAGTYVCNHVFYGLMHRLAARPGVRGGFMHLPLLPAQAARRPGPSLPLATQVEGVRVALAAAWAHTQDLRVAGGAEC
ncbi:pyroglutamyl-peptidase I [Rubrivivax gelatinosus]|uniref:pyroglutamyl-peptidase I n=1 Tax=Rubrivivax gelatinosus TaxID=28068 RepID=UPI0018C98F83|nr:pyroglutamyl-peptidase I [Rubrivivax gelatinosus]